MISNAEYLIVDVKYIMLCVSHLYCIANVSSVASLFLSLFVIRQPLMFGNLILIDMHRCFVLCAWRCVRRNPTTKMCVSSSLVLYTGDGRCAPGDYRA